MRVTVFNGSPRRNGNTSALTSSLLETMAGRGAEAEEVMLFVKNILGCNNCGRCQSEDLPSRCSIPDDMSCLYPKFLDSDLVVFATPIYMWNFTPCTLAFMTRLHCLCRHGEPGFNLMKGKKAALALTMGDEASVASAAIAGFREFCAYFGMEYAGHISVPFADREKIASGEYLEEEAAFAGRVLSQS
ncbi:MAG: flavodoxin family protein [Candidatus Methanoplasma sp.]|jgi:multimeric flavodoxin WrbA|nr:flavodoxin family protein [Candidatus Methanoplasma sp.]